MTFLEEVHAKRQKLAEVLLDEEYSGIREIVEQLYPDRAHFIYELLQNAEDTEATTARFQLGRDRLTFEHNGRPFNETDIWRITNIGKSSKREERDKIGQFGIGFKAVFAYSDTPRIWSPTFSFQIDNLVLPTALKAMANLGPSTHFEFPFNNPKKKADLAHREIEAGLNDIAETTLLFLPHLQSIQWQIGSGSAGEVRRVQHSEHHFEVLKETGSRTTGSHFLRFDRTVEGLEKLRVAIAFLLDFVPSVRQFDSAKPLVKQMKIVPAAPGRVAVFFPAEKETSGLRFHLHAPFVPELSRASIKDTPANQPLFRQLAELSAASLHAMRDLGLLSVDLLSVLPNPQDEQIPPRYECIRAAIVEEMNQKPLTPTHSKSHAPAKVLLQAKASLKELLSEKDLELLVDYDGDPPQWAVGVTQKNSDADRFLGGLKITDWDIEDFIELLIEKASEGTHYARGRFLAGPDSDFAAWLAEKPAEWLLKLYSLLYTELSTTGDCDRLKDARIVRLGNGKYSVGVNCFFSTDGVEEDELLPRVDVNVYTSGKSKAQQANARKLLEAIGVREVGEAEQVEVILKKRYTSGNFKPQKQDLKRFVALVEKDSTKSTLFGEYFIFESKNGKWRKPGAIFLDEPFIDTGLSAYYERLGKDAARAALADSYTDCGVALKRLVKFAESAGAQTRLEISQTRCHSNPQYSYLRAAPGERYTSPIDRDFTIVGLDTLLAKPSIALARLIWRTMCSLPANPDYLRATFRKSESWGARQADSQLVHHLRTVAWIPQGDGLFVRPADASRDLLPDGFAYDAGLPWLKAVGFGREIAAKSEEKRQKDTVAKELGFRDEASLDRAKRFAALPAEEQERILADREHAPSTPLPENESANPERRAERVATKAASAPERRTELRTRSVSIGRDEVKLEAMQYLRQQYTNTDAEMICQICMAQLPFKLDDGTDYFEIVEFLPELKKRHYQNYLALCPNHAAMFQYANNSEDSIRDAFIEVEGNELEVVLAQRERAVYFTKTHIADLKEVIRVDRMESRGAETSLEPGAPVASTRQ
jgi:hypothetical protein